MPSPLHPTTCRGCHQDDKIPNASSGVGVGGLKGRKKLKNFPLSPDLSPCKYAMSFQDYRKDSRAADPELSLTRPYKLSNKALIFITRLGKLADCRGFQADSGDSRIGAASSSCDAARKGQGKAERFALKPSRFRACWPGLRHRRKSGPRLSDRHAPRRLWPVCRTAIPRPAGV